jgi:hypothetical protein
MQLEGTVQDGVVVLDRKDAIPEGTRVEVIPIPANPPPSGTEASDAGRSLWDRLANVVGKGTGLPADASQRVDHCLTHGLPDE